MKVLFAVSSESISDAIIKKYQKEYKEILSYKNVYYFNAILKEIQKDKTYDRIIISEDLEPFSNNNYDAIDKFIFEKLDNISDEAQDIDGNETSIILICTDRHTKGSSFLVKLFGIGIYNALLGSERSMEQVCKLINKPRVKKEAKIYYKIDAEDVNYSNKNEKEVSELEIQNILTHFKKLGKNTDKFAESFNSIASQYTDEQLKIIINCLPINVKAVLEEDCPKYQELMSVNGLITRVNSETMKTKAAQKQTGIKIDIIENKINQNKMSGPIVIPSSVRTSKNKGPAPVRPVGNNIEVKTEKSQDTNSKKVVKRVEPPQTINSTRPIRTPEATARIEARRENLLNKKVSNQAGQEAQNRPVNRIEKNNSTANVINPLINKKAQRTEPDIQQVSSRPPVQMNETETAFEKEQVLEKKKGRGRPRKEPVDIEPKEKGKRGRPKKQPEGEDEVVLPGMDDDFEIDNSILPGLDDNFESSDIDEVLPGLDGFEDSDDEILPGLDDFEDSSDDDLLPGLEDDFENSNEDDYTELPGLDDSDDTIDDEMLPGLDDDFEDSDEEEYTELPGMDNEFDDLEAADEMLPGIDDDFEDSNEEDTELPGLDNEFDDLEADDEMLPGIDDDFEDSNEEYTELPGMDNEFDDLEVDDEMLPGIDDDFEDSNEEEYTELPGLDNEFDDLEADDEILPGMNDDFEEVDEEDTDGALPGLDDDFDDVQDAEDYTDEVDLPGLDELDELDDLDDFSSSTDTFESDDNDDLLPGIENDDDIDTSDSLLSEFDDEEPLNQTQNIYSEPAPEIESIKPRVDYSMSSLNSLLTKDKKIVTFLGTTKNGTSFLVNNLAALFSSCGISTAILDMTKNKNSYYIYTNNEEELRNIAYNSISKLQKGFAEGIKVNKNLSIYTALPNDGKDYSDAEPILSTLVQNHSLILIDCDFDTDPSYFASCQEIYLVQSMDILTIQPLTAYLRDLKAKGVLESEKVRVVINKEIKVRSLTTKAIIGGMSFYNDPSMSFMTELFNKDMVKACSIPFEDNAYSKYLDAMVNCNVSLNGYSKSFLNKLKNLGDMVYPLVSKSSYGKAAPQQINYGKNAFSKNMNNTLNQMKNKF